MGRQIIAFSSGHEAGFTGVECMVAIASMGVAKELAEEARLKAKREIYAELVELNAGIVTPVVLN